VRHAGPCSSVSRRLQVANPPGRIIRHPVIVARLPTFLEGVVFDRHGVAYVSELWSETIWRIGPGEVPTAGPPWPTPTAIASFPMAVT